MDIANIGYNVDTSGLKAGESALDSFHAKNKSAAEGTSTLSRALGGIQAQLVALSAGSGPVGTFLAGLGPTGFAAAVGLGALSQAFSSVSEGALKFRQYSRDLKDTSESTGLLSSDLQGLSAIALQHGVSWERASYGVNYFNLQRDQASRGSGPLYDALRRINPALAEQFALARSTGEAMAIYGKALADVDTKTASSLSRAGLGRNQFSLGQTIADISRSGGLDPAVEQLRKYGLVIEQEVIDKQFKAAVAAEQKAKATELAWQQAYASIYEKWKDFKNLIGIGDNNTISITVAMTIKQAVESIGAPESLSQLRAKELELQRQISERSSQPQVNSISDMARRNRDVFGLGSARSFDGDAAPAGGLKSLEDSLQKVREKIEAIIWADISKGYEEMIGRMVGPTMPSAEDLRNDRIRALTLDKERLAIRTAILSVEEQVRARMDDVNIAIENGVPILNSQKEALRALYTAQANGTDAIKQSSDAQRIQAATIGLSVGAAAALSEKLKLLYQDQRLGIVASNETTAAREREAAALGRLTQATAEKKLQDSISFERSQIGRTDIDATAYAQVRSALGEVDSATSQAMISQIRYNEQLKQAKEISSSFANDFGQAMLKGKTAAEALNGALQNMASTIMSMATKNLTTSLFGGLFGGTTATATAAKGGLFGGSIIPGILHEGGIVGGVGMPGRYVHPAYFDGASRYQTGGIAGLAPDEVPAVLHRDEEVLTRNDPRHRWNGGGATSGGSIKMDVNVNLEGANGDAAIEAAVGRGVSGAIVIAAQNLVEYDKGLPARLKEINVRGV